MGRGVITGNVVLWTARIVPAKRKPVVGLVGAGAWISLYALRVVCQRTLTLRCLVSVRAMISGEGAEVIRRVTSTIVEYMPWTLSVDMRIVWGRNPAWGMTGGGEER